MNELQEQIYNETFMDELEKIAEGEDPTWWQQQVGAARAEHAWPTKYPVGFRGIKAIGHRAGGGLTGAAVGAGAGFGAGKAIEKILKRVKGKGKVIAAPAALIASIGGLGIGEYLGRKKFLGKRGITPKALGLAGYKYTPEAQKKYIEAYQKIKKTA